MKKLLIKLINRSEHIIGESLLPILMVLGTIGLGRQIINVVFGV